MVHTLVVFADGLTTVKIKTLKDSLAQIISSYEGHTYGHMVRMRRALSRSCVKYLQVLTTWLFIALRKSKQMTSRNLSYSCIAFYNSDSKRIRRLVFHR